MVCRKRKDSEWGRMVKPTVKCMDRGNVCGANWTGKNHVCAKFESEGSGSNAVRSMLSKLWFPITW